MFDTLKESLKKKREEDAKAETLRHQQRDAEDRAKLEHERKIAGIRVITGDVRYRYVILDTLRVFTHYAAQAGEPYDPTAATTHATRQMQELAYAAGADAVIHAQYQILRYTSARRNYIDVPSYETHLFGTAIKIMGPPKEWEEESN
jgi:uncharacterized protein YbjQ (UPF0145 family)